MKECNRGTGLDGFALEKVRKATVISPPCNGPIVTSRSKQPRQ